MPLRRWEQVRWTGDGKLYQVIVPDTAGLVIIKDRHGEFKYVLRETLERMEQDKGNGREKHTGG